MKKSIAKLIIFGNGGDFVHCGTVKKSKCNISGYGTPEHPHASKPSESLEIPDGCPVIDKRPALKTQAGLLHAIEGPMVDVDLPDGKVSTCPEPSSHLANGVSGSYKTLLTIHQAQKDSDPEKTGALDCVSISAYVDGWRKVGARIGHYESGSIVWDDEKSD